MTKITLHKKDKKLRGTIVLPGSKSESNRALIIQALCKEPFEIHNLSPAEDTQLLKSQISSRNISGLKSQIVDCKHAGTTFRFLTAYYASQDRTEKIITGSDRLKSRPVGPLVDSLRELGANISYLGKEGYPPLKIIGKELTKTNHITINANVSSQFISALLLIAPTLPNGLIIDLEAEIVSAPYIEMTLSMIQHFGVNYHKEKNTIAINKQDYKPKDIFIESDWSNASYWYAMAALSDETDLVLKGLKGYSLQGDSITAELMANFGVATQFMNDGIRLTRTTKKPERKIFDMQSCPDLAQTIIVVCAALKHEATFTGLQTLRIKETDRIKALQNELQKLGAELIEKGHVYKLQFNSNEPEIPVNIKTYDDHRMAMSFAPLSLVKEIIIEDPNVIVKSYPAFWEDLKTVGFDLRSE